jgi:hypothetical protein
MGTGTSKQPSVDVEGYPLDVDGEKVQNFARNCRSSDDVGAVSRDGKVCFDPGHNKTKYWLQCRHGLKKEMVRDDDDNSTDDAVKMVWTGNYECHKPPSKSKIKAQLDAKVTSIEDLGETLDAIQKQAGPRFNINAGSASGSGLGDTADVARVLHFNMDKRRRSRRRRSRSKCKRGRVRSGSRCKRKPGPKRRSRSRKRSRSRRRSRKVSRKRRSHTSVAMSRARANQRRRRSRRR